MTVFLEVFGRGDYGAMLFAENCNVQKIYESMVEDGITEKEIEMDNEVITIRIHEFREIDPKFIDLVIDVLGNYDTQKSHDIFEVTPVV